MGGGPFRIMRRFYAGLARQRGTPSAGKQLIEHCIERRVHHSGDTFLTSMKNAVVSDCVTKHRSSKDIGRVMRSQRDSGETHRRSETVGDPSMPTRILLTTV